jgi:hypothetical protein
MASADLNLELWKLPPPPDHHEENGRIDLTGDPNDYHCILLASMGMSYAVISRQTGLSIAQIGYRLRRLNQNRREDKKINSRNYRNGTSQAAQAVIDLASSRVARIITPIIRKELARDDAGANVIDV